MIKGFLKHVTFLFLFVFLPYSYGSDRTDDYVITPSDELFFSKLTPNSTVEKNVLKRLVSGLKMSDEKASEAKVQRLLTSDLFSVRVGERNYLIGPDAKNWVQSEFEGFYIFGDGVRSVSVSNESKESLLSMQFLLKNLGEYLPLYGDINAKTKFYAFIDVTCPHCRDFHLFSRTDFERAGVSFIYVPFLRNSKDYLAQTVNKRAFCSSSKLEIKSKLNKLFSLSRSELEADLTPPKCNRIQSSIFDFLLLTGDRYNLRGSPMFMSMNGDVIYGVPSLKRYVYEVNK